MDYKYLTRKQYILEGGIAEKGTVDTVIPFANMEVELVSTFQPGDKVTLATEERMEYLVKQGISGSHKSIAGEYEVTTVADVTSALSTYAGGGDLTFTNGRVFNNGNASPGEVFFFIPTAGSKYKAEEMIVGATKNLIALSNENDIDNSLNILTDDIDFNKQAIAKKLDTTTFTSTMLYNAQSRADITTAYKAADTAIEADATALELRVKTNETDIVNIKDKDTNQDIRIGALEAAEEITDKVWEGSIAVEIDTSLVHIKDQDGNSFDFGTGKKLEVVIADTSTNTEQGHNLTIDGNSTTFTIGTRTLTVRFVSSGRLLCHSSDAELFTDLVVTEIIEPKVPIGVSVFYTKNEADGLFATQTALGLATKDIADLTTDLGTKLGTTDNSLTTSTKSIVGAINELDGKIKVNDPLVARLGGLKTSDGDDLSTTTENLVTEKTITARGYMTKAEVDSAIAAALAVAMNVVFDDTSTGSFKIGK